MSATGILRRALTTVLEHAPELAVQIFDREGVVRSWNVASERLYGWTSSEAVGQRADLLCLPGFAFAALIDVITGLDRGEDSVGPVELPARHRDGHQVQALSTLFAIPADDGERRFVRMDIDITHRVRLSEALAAVAGTSGGGAAFYLELLRHLARLLGVRYALAALVSPDGRSATTVAMLADGADAGQCTYSLAGTPCDAVVSGDICSYQSGVAALYPEDRTLVELGIQAYFGVPIYDDQGRRIGVVAAYHDRPSTPPYEHRSALRLFATRIGAELQRQRREEEGQRAQRLAALGQLAGGVAHDFNNYLGLILGSAELLALSRTLDPISRQHVARIDEATRSSAKLVGRMLTIARPGGVELETFQLDALIDSAIELFLPSCHHVVRVVHERSAGRIEGRGLPVQIQSALLNLLLNARDAMPEGGEIRVGSGVVELSAAEAALVRPVLPPGRYQGVTVTDSGTGMVPGVASRLFEPFFTTKEPGRGTGLGLPSVLACARDHGGGVTVTTVPGGGTTVGLLLSAPG